MMIIHDVGTSLLSLRDVPSNWDGICGGIDKTSQPVGLFIIADCTYDPRQIVRKGFSIKFWTFCIAI